jgi:choline-glycine betaine transporter
MARRFAKECAQVATNLRTRIVAHNNVVAYCRVQTALTVGTAAAFVMTSFDPTAFVLGGLAKVCVAVFTTTGGDTDTDHLLDPRLNIQ